VERRGAQVAAGYLVRLADPAQPVLDAGCGTGLVGLSLKARSIDEIVGIDLSPDSIKLAEQTGAYARLHRVDSTRGCRLPAFGAAVYTGVLSYVPDVRRWLANSAA